MGTKNNGSKKAAAKESEKLSETTLWMNRTGKSVSFHNIPQAAKPRL